MASDFFDLPEPLDVFFHVSEPQKPLEVRHVESKLGEKNNLGGGFIFFLNHPYWDEHHVVDSPSILF